VPWPVMAARGKARAAVPLATMEGPKHVDVGASLADQDLAIGIGANLPSAAGGPIDTLVALRPLLAAMLWAHCPGAALRWSPLFRTAPVGGPPGQPDYINAVLLAHLPVSPTDKRASQFLQELQGLEQRFGRVRVEHWGPRSLDLDLLWWGSLQLQTPELTLPHPRWPAREFVLAPLAALQPSFQPQLDQILSADPGLAPERLPPRAGWEE